MLKSVVVPIIKNKNKRISDKDNYRPICISNAFTKVVEKVLYSRMEDYLQSTHNQFGLKQKHGTEMCVFERTYKILYQTWILYVCAFLDASKAFDRVNHMKLFSMLLKLGVPEWIIKVLAQWYFNQSVCVTWGSVFSDLFLVTNGVTQEVSFPRYCSICIYNSVLTCRQHIIKATLYAISSDTHQLQLIKLHHFKLERFKSI